MSLMVIIDKIVMSNVSVRVRPDDKVPRIIYVSFLLISINVL